MANDKSKKKKKKSGASERILRIEYPIRLIFQVSTLTGAITFIVMNIGDDYGVLANFFRAFVVFSVVAVSGGFLMVVIFSMLAHKRLVEMEDEERKRREAEEALELAEGEDGVEIFDEQDGLSLPMGSSTPKSIEAHAELVGS